MRYGAQAGIAKAATRQESAAEVSHGSACTKGLPPPPQQQQQQQQKQQQSTSRAQREKPQGSLAGVLLQRLHLPLCLHGLGILLFEL